MHRAFALVFLLALGLGVAMAKDDQPGKGAQQEFVNAFLHVRKGEELEKAGDLRTALTTFRSAAGMLAKIKKDSPGWQTEIVDFRLKRTMEAIDRVQTKLGGPAPGTDAAGPGKER